MISVLVVDDDFMVARIHTAFVEKTIGFSVAGTARSGAEALALVATLAPDLLLLDVHLPDMSGLDVLRRLRAEGNTVAVVMVTADRDVDVVRTALHGGAMQYLVKPFEYVDFALRLDHVRETLEALAAGDTDQETIDRAFGAASSATPLLPKGLSNETADLVAETLRSRGEISAGECGEALGISRVTARRYLEHFVEHGQAVVRLNYGSAGRPQRRYRPK